MTRTSITTTKVTITGALWMLAVTLGIVGSMTDEIRVLFWSGLVALAAAVLSGHLIAERAVRVERLNVEQLLDGLIASAEQRSDLPRLR